MAEIFQNNRTSFFAGQSEDDSIGQEGTYNYGEGLEVKRFSKFVELAKAPVNSVSHLDTTSTTRLGVETPNPVGINPIFFLGDDGKIVKEDGTLVFTESGARDLQYHVFNIGDSLYFTCSDGVNNPMRLNKILHSNIDNSWGSDVLEDILSGDTLELIEPGLSGYHRFLVVGTICYISSGNKIAKFNHNTGEVESHFSFFPSDIVGMTYGGGHIKVFLKNGLMYLWNGVDEEQPLDIVPLGEKLENATTIGAIEYIIGGDLGGLSKFFILDGNRLVEIYSKQYSRLLGIDKFNIQTTGNFQNIAYSDNQIYLVDFLDVGLGERRISSYGNKINGLTKGYSVDVTKNTNGNTMGSLTFIFTAQGKVFFGYVNTSVDKGVDYINLNQNNGPFVSEGFIIDKLFDGGDIIKVKKEEKFYGKCEIPEGTSIEILQSNNGSSFVTCKTIDENTKLNNGVFTLSQTSFNAGSQYREVSYKIILRTTDEDVSPKWYGFKTKYSFTD